MAVIGINEHDEVVYIDQVKRGATQLKCPYCGGLLTAKKGAIKSPHFAHTNQTCLQTTRPHDTIALPGYDNFNLHLPGRALKELQTFVINPDAADKAYLAKRELIELEAQESQNVPGELTKKGKLVLGLLPLALFNDYQEALILEKLKQIEETARLAYQKNKALIKLRRTSANYSKTTWGYAGSYYADSAQSQAMADLNTANDPEALLLQNRKILDFETAMTDLRLYRAQLRRVLSCSLYFLHIVEPDLYKIGVTTRDVAARVAEIRTELQQHCGPVTIEVIGLWPYRGNVELYFKHRYKKYRQTIGGLTEYFRFAADINAVQHDLNQMQAKQLTDLERAILDGKPSGLERDIALEQAKEQHQAAIQPKTKNSSANALTRLVPGAFKAFWKRFTVMLDHGHYPA